MVSSAIPENALTGTSLVGLLDGVTQRLAAGDAAVDSSVKGEHSVFAAELHEINHGQWNLESDIRDEAASGEQITMLRRAISESNTRRHAKIERLDAAFRALHGTAPQRDASPILSSETLGQVVDRLSVLTLRVWHMSRHHAGNGAQVTVAAQRDHVARCYDWLLGRWLAGACEPPPDVRHFKAYQDSRLDG